MDEDTEGNGPHTSQSEVEGCSPSEHWNTSYTTCRQPYEWKSKWLRPSLMLPIAVVTGALIAAVIVLAIVSKKNHGIASANLTLEVLTSIVPDFGIGIGLLWTFLPVLIFEVYVLTIAAIVKAAAVRQPYIELREQGENRHWGAPAEKSILLDYGSYWAPVAPLHALRFNHYMLSFSFGMMLLLNLILTSLAAHLFFATTISVPHRVDVQRSSKFASSLNQDAFGFQDSLSPTMNIVSSTLVYGGGQIPWTTFNESFLPVSLEHSLDSSITSRNLTVPAISLSVSVNCQVLGPSSFELEMVSTGDWLFSINDRGCSIADQEFTTPLTAPFDRDFVQTYPFQQCGQFAQYSRIVVVAALNANSSRTILTNKTAISCIPSYYTTSGSLSLTVDPIALDHPKINGFVPFRHEKIDPPPQFGYNFEKMIHLARNFDPDGALQASQYGNLIYTYAKKM